MVANSIEDLETAIETNASWEEDGSLSKAKAFVTAVRRYLMRYPNSSSNQSSSMSFDFNVIQSQLLLAKQYIALNDTASASNTRVRFFDASGYRS